MISQKTIEELKEFRRNMLVGLQNMTKDGYVLSGRRYQYQWLVREAKELNDCIKYLESLNANV